LERDIVAKEAELSKVHENLAREDEENERESGRGKGKSTGSDEKVQSQHALKARALEEEIESLGRQLERVRMEADEEFAREIAEGELGRH
jgi:collagen type V/XI/XXIV/XXVII alpha